MDSPCPTFLTLPSEIILQILSYASTDPQTLTSVALTNLRLSRLIRSIRRGGQYALHVDLSNEVVSERFSVSKPGPTTSSHGFVTLTKNSEPGHGYAPFNYNILSCSVHWSFRLDRFTGNRIDIGVARLNGPESASSWSFDCFGRVSVKGKVITYGRRMQTGDVVGILYNYALRTLSFLDNGVSMGSIELEPDAIAFDNDHALLPFVYIPHLEGESVTLLGSSSVLDLRLAESKAKLWKRPTGLRCDSMVIVHTWDDRVWYAIDEDCETTTLRRMFIILEERHGVARDQFELISDGRRLKNTNSKTLRDVGIFVDERTGTCVRDILLSVPHLVS